MGHLLLHEIPQLTDGVVCTRFASCVQVASCIQVASCVPVTLGRRCSGESILLGSPD